MATISFYLDGQDELLIKNYAKSKNMSVSSFLRSVAVEKIEDDIDNRLYERAMREDGGIPQDITLDEIKRELDIYC